MKMKMNFFLLPALILIGSTFWFSTASAIEIYNFTGATLYVITSTDTGDSGDCNYGKGNTIPPGYGQSLTDNLVACIETSGVADSYNQVCPKSEHLSGHNFLTIDQKSYEGTLLTGTCNYHIKNKEDTKVVKVISISFKAICGCLDPGGC